MSLRILMQNEPVDVVRVFRHRRLIFKRVINEEEYEMNVKSEIDTFVESKPVAIDMKGSPDFPQWGFSAQAIGALRHCGVKDEDLAHFDVLTNPEIRQGIKDYTNWPTIPQVFVKGKFIGGCDVVVEMAQKGELQNLLNS